MKTIQGPDQATGITYTDRYDIFTVAPAKLVTA